MELPTLEGVVKEVRISLDLLEQKCSDDHLKSISLFMDWRSVAPHLGLSERDIEAIEVENRRELERSLKVLQKWKRMFGYTATFRKLVEAILVVRNAEDAEKVCRLLKTPGGDHKQSSPVTATEANLSSTVVEPSKVSIQSSKSDIDKEIQELERQFLKVVREARKDLTTVELSEVKLCVTQLPVSVRYRHIRFLEHNRSAITSATSVDDVLAILGLYWSYFNCGLLNEIVHQLGNDATKLIMEQYMEKLRRFRMKTKLRDFVGKSTHAIPNFVELVTKLGKDWGDRTLEDLEEFRKKFAESMHLEDYAVYATRTEAGCIAVTWALHSSLPEITDTLQSAFQQLQKKYGILRVIFQGKCIPEPEPPEFPPLATPPTPLPLPSPLERSEPETNTFDVIAALLSAGVPHIVEQILQSLDEKSLAMSEQVSSIWREVIANLHLWKHLIKHKIASNPLWRAIFKRRGWNKYLDMPPAEQMSKQFYRQLHHSASRDIHSLEANWRRGHYTLTRVETGSRVLCLQYDDRKILTGHSDNTIKVWDRSTLQLLQLLKGHKQVVSCLQFQEEVAISGSYDHTVKVWDVRTGKVINDLHHHKGAVSSLKFTTDTLVTGSHDGTVAVWKIVSPTDITLRMTLKGHEGSVLAVDLSETMHHHLWIFRQYNQEFGTLILENVYECYMDMLNLSHSCIAVDNRRILSGSVDKTIKVWDLAAALDADSSSDTLCIATLKEHTGWVRAVQCDDFQIISGSNDGTLVIHDFLDLPHPILRT